ncbi:MAG: sigma-70 family RNA polymerase sigma factor [Anaerolineales bacterium]
MNNTDTELLNLAKDFDQTALTNIYDRYSTALYRYAYHQTGNQQIAEDCVSETFSRFLKALQNKRGPKDYLKAYLYRIAHNWITDLYRRKSSTEESLNEVEFALPAENAKVEATVLKGITAETLRQQIARLNQAQRQVIVLKHLEGLGNAEVAEIIGKNVGSVKALNSRGLNNLRKFLNEDEVFLE